jgi:uncharacterized membrane protein
MRRTMLVGGLLLLICLASAAGIAQSSNSATQTPTSQSPQASPSPSPKVENPYAASSGPKAPDMVCFGYYPTWSVQFINGEARYLGYNEPDRYMLGNFYWVPDEKVWSWHRANGLAPTDGGFALSATIQQAACHDDVLKANLPYSAQVYLPQGDMVSGCCRKLKPGEAPVGRHGLPPNDVGPNSPATRQPPPPANNQPQAGHPVDQ